jgi:acyl-coenzyme A synthetase/AMP-(fatty) acid ligase
MYNEEEGTEDVVVIVEVDSEDPAEQQKIADEVRMHVTKNSAVALRYVRAVDPKWILKTSSGKTARSANKEKFLAELEKER